MTTSWTDALLLQALRQPRYGAQITEAFREASAGTQRFAPGTLYPALRRLERAGYLRAWTVGGNRGRPRKYYELTAAGVRRESDMSSTLRRLLARERPAGPAATVMALRISRALRLGISARKTAVQLAAQTPGA